MDSQKRRALEAAGWRFGDAADFLGLSDEERQLLDARLEVAQAVRRQREALKLSQQQLAKRINTSQPRVAKIERAAADVSLDQLLRAFAAVGGRIAVTHVGQDSTAKTARKPPRSGRKKANSDEAAESAAVRIELTETE